MGDTPHQILIDVRTKVVAPLELSRQLLGLSALERALRTVRRAGFDDITLATDNGAKLTVPQLGGVRCVAHRDLPGTFAGPTVYMAGQVLAEVAWLKDAAATMVGTGTVLSFGDGVAIAGAGSSLDAAAAVADTRPTTSSTMRINSSADVVAAEDRLVATLVKDTDGFMARRVARPISLWLSRRLARTRITPNQMTLVSLMIGLAAAPFFLSSAPWLQGIGGLLFVAHSVIDGCDGELARLKFTESHFGGLLDFWADNIIHVAVFGCMAIGWALAEQALWPLWFGGAAVLGTGCSALTVYWMTLRQKSGDGPVYTSVTDGPGSRMTKLLDELSRRDFIYLVFALSIFGKAAWFLVATAIGAPVFLALVLTAAWWARTRPVPGDG